MALHNKLFLIDLNLEGPNAPSWDFMSDEYWKNMLDNFMFKIADSFAFAGVFKKADLFPKGLNYFSDWQLDIIGLVETEDDIVCRFNLNNDCKRHFLKFEFAVHYFESKEFNNYYKFDQLYFLNGERIVAAYINHESMIEFLLTDNEAALIEALDPPNWREFRRSRNSCLAMMWRLYLPCRPSDTRRHSSLRFPKNFAYLRNFRRLGRVTALSRKGVRPPCRLWVSGAVARRCPLPALATDQAASAA